MKTLSKGLAIFIIIVNVALLVSTAIICLTQAMQLLHILVVMSFVAAFVVSELIFAVDWLVDLYRK